MCVPTMRLSDVNLRKLSFIVNVIIVFAALWLVSCTSLSIIELITDSDTSSE